MQPTKAGENDGLAETWSRLCTGHARVLESGQTGRAFYLTVGPSPLRAVVAAQPPEHRPPPAEFRLLQGLLLGLPILTLSSELGVSVAAVTTKAVKCLRAMGIESERPSRVPVVLVIAAHAAAGITKLTSTRSVIHAGRVRFEIDRFDGVLRARLTAAEFAVLRFVVEGLPTLEIARMRGVATGTVAGQVRNALTKLQVSGRAGLLSRLVREWAPPDKVSPSRTGPLPS